MPANFRLFGFVIPMIMILTAVAGCSSPSLGRYAAGQGVSANGFLLTMDRQSSEIGGGRLGSCTITVDQGQATVVTVFAENSESLKAAYFSLQYDPAAYSLADASPAWDEGQAEELLHLAVESKPGLITYGQVLPGWDRQAGFNGRLALARFTFKKADGSAAKLTSAAPASDASSADLSMPVFGEFNWLYGNNGDYSQDGVVTINDLTPLGLYFGSTGPFPVDTVRWVVDGNRDGEINISDITPIGANFGASALGGYHLYGSTSITDYPGSNTADSLIPPAASVPFGDALGDRGADRLLFHASHSPAVPAFYSWVRPVDEDGNEGTPSNMLSIDVAGSPTLSLVTPAIGGSGTFDDPYLVENSLDYEISMVHPSLGDVTDQVGAIYTLVPISPGGPGAAVNIPERRLEINDAFTGMFMLGARFNENPATPALVFRVHDATNIAPVAFFLTNVNSGTAPLDVIANAMGSSDPDGIIIKYEWDYETDGIWDYHTDFLHIPEATILYEAGGEMEITLRVTDDQGAISMASWPIDVAGWQKILVDGRTGVGTDPALAVIGGIPAIAYTDTAGNVNYTRALNDDGLEWLDPVTLSDTFIASQVSLMEVGGMPTVVYRRGDAVSSGIKYTRAVTVQGSGWNSATVSTGANDHSPALAVISGRPAIAYSWYNGSPTKPYTLAYIRAAEATGTESGTWDSFPSLVFTADLIRLGKHSLYPIQGKPTIMFESDGDELGDGWRLRQVVADDVFASGWGFPGFISAGGAVIELGHFDNTLIVERPHFVLRLDGSGTATFRKAHNLDGTDWGSLYGVSDCLGDDSRGYFVSMANIAGFPGIVHYDSVNEQLRYVRSMDPESAGGWNGGEVVADVGEWDTAITYNNYASLASISGKPMVAYYDATDLHLYFSTYYEIP